MVIYGCLLNYLVVMFIKQTNIQTQLSKQTEKIKGQILYSALWSKTNKYSERKKKIKKQRLKQTKLTAFIFCWCQTKQTNIHTYKLGLWNKLERLGDTSSMVDSRARPNAVKEKKKMKKQTNYWKREMLLCCASFYQSRYHSLAKHVIRLINVTETFLE